MPRTERGRLHSFSPATTPAMLPIRGHWPCLLLSSLLAALAVAPTTAAYEVPISDSDYDRQICSGMWGGGSNTFINGAR